MAKQYRRISYSPWFAIYDSDTDEIINGNEIYVARTRALNKGCVYLIKVYFKQNSYVVKEFAVSGKKCAQAWLNYLIKDKTVVSEVAIMRIKGSERYAGGNSFYYEGLQFVEEKTND